MFDSRPIFDLNSVCKNQNVITIFIICNSKTVIIIILIIYLSVCIFTFISIYHCHILSLYLKFQDNKNDNTLASYLIQCSSKGCGS